MRKRLEVKTEKTHRHIDYQPTLIIIWLLAAIASFCCGSPKISSLNTGLTMSSKISCVGKGLVADLVDHGFYFTLSKRTFCVIHLKSK